MRLRTSCSFCRSRKKRCILPAGALACRQCRAKRRQCDHEDLHERAPLSERNEGTESGQTVSVEGYTSTLPARALPAHIEHAEPHPSYPADCDELVDLYFNVIHYKQHLLFHPPTFMQQYRKGEAVDYLIFGMIALGARFSEGPAWQHVIPTERSQPLLAKAIDRFYKRAELISLASLQGAMLLGFAAFVDGAIEQESLLGAQAIRMVQLLGLKDQLGVTRVEREVANALLWQAWIMDAWHAGRGSYPRQLELSSDQPKVIEELEFISMMDLQTDRVHTLPNRNGIWTAMLPLHQILSEVMQLNSSLAISSSRSPEMIIRARQLDRTLQRWLQGLPAYMHNNSANLARYDELGFGRTFLVMHAIYNHTAQLLFFHALKTKSHSVWMAPEECEQSAFVSKCKGHAAALSELMWTASRNRGLECLWSPGNGHLLVVASCVHLHSLLIDDDDAGATHARTLLEQNFTLLIGLRKYWTGVERSLSRLRSSHRACQLSRRLASVFDMDQWMAKFLIKDDISVPDRYGAPVQPDAEPEDFSPAFEGDIEFLWKN